MRRPHSGYAGQEGEWGGVRIRTYPSAPVNVPGGGLQLQREEEGDMERCMTGEKSYYKPPLSASPIW